ncbi:hypothetical protein [Abyssisolibacter fermentans]|uniref:hypothetical protein n=1 Tax=Abyssisolibacter fermentans TaxID=1766203 RepID=UPI0012E3D97A|nr:hypothetical protein [Abyssisolibacter fermentans]
MRKKNVSPLTEVIEEPTPDTDMSHDSCFGGYWLLFLLVIIILVCFFCGGWGGCGGCY